ncbi:MAG: sulfatase-like hydrolase/transferase, partial [Planctomycetota bacterium]|nr:sulfatase-like hydrolase/transferase [Planctomycetota bacterium]
GDVAPWRLVGGTVKHLGLEQGTVIRPRRATSNPSIVYDGQIVAEEYAVLEVEVRLPVVSAFTLTWSAGGETHRLERDVGDSNYPKRVRFHLASEPGWRGTVSDLTIVFAVPGRRAYGLHALRFETDGFEWGFEPLGQERIGAEGSSGDAGLRRLGFECRRAWPSDADVPLYARAPVPRAGLLSVAIAPGKDSFGTDEELFFAVDARLVNEDDWERVGETTVRPEANPTLSHWRPLVCDLRDFGGKEVELRFLASLGSAPDPDGFRDDGSLPRAEWALFGAPMILGEMTPDRRPDVVLITLDTARADALGAGFTPFLDRFAAGGVAFENAWANCNATTPSHASILTGLHVQEHGATSNRHALPPEAEPLAERFRAAGYHTVAAVSVAHIQAGAGFGQGFDWFGLTEPGANEDGQITVERVLAWLGEIEDAGERPLFLWLHLFDPHTPYGPPEGWTAVWLEEHDLAPPPARVEPPTIPVRYVPSPDGPVGNREVPVPLKRWLGETTSLEHVRFTYALGMAYIDFLCETVLGAMEERGLLDRAAVVITGDHGESLGEHGIWFTHAGLFPESMRVPLILRVPGGPMGMRVEAPVSNLDIAPTLYRFCGVSGPPGLRGLDLLATARHGGDDERPIWLEYTSLLQLGLRNGRRHFVTTRKDGVFYGTRLSEVDGRVVSTRRPPFSEGRNLLYDLVEDPGLERNVAAERTQEVEAMLRAVDEWRATLEEARVIRRDLSGDEERRLEDLGYGGKDELDEDG